MRVAVNADGLKLTRTHDGGLPLDGCTFILVSR